MDINRIREFLVLSEHLNYSKAANLLYITQPVLSRHIHDLEETLGGSCSCGIPTASASRNSASCAQISFGKSSARLTLR